MTVKNNTPVQSTGMSDSDMDSMIASMLSGAGSDVGSNHVEQQPANTEDLSTPDLLPFSADELMEQPNQVPVKPAQKKKKSVVAAENVEQPAENTGIPETPATPEAPVPETTSDTSDSVVTPEEKPEISEKQMADMSPEEILAELEAEMTVSTVAHQE